jgi:hypothetical protein
MLVQDLANLEWQRRRVERAEGGLLVREMEKLELQHEKRAQGLGGGSFAGSEAETLITGLRQAADSPGKFETLTGDIKYLVGRVKRREFSQCPEGFLKSLYGTLPTCRGAQISRLFRYFAERPPTVPPEEDENDKILYTALLGSLLEEERDLVTEYELYCREHVEITPALRSAVLAPSAAPWATLLRQKNAIACQIERKLKLLFTVQRERRPREARQTEEPADS